MQATDEVVLILVVLEVGGQQALFVLLHSEETANRMGSGTRRCIGSDDVHRKGGP